MKTDAIFRDDCGVIEVRKGFGRIALTFSELSKIYEVAQEKYCYREDVINFFKSGFNTLCNGAAIIQDQDLIRSITKDYARIRRSNDKLLTCRSMSKMQCLLKAVGNHKERISKYKISD